MRDDLLLIKGHFFFLFAALGPILPFISVIGKQLGISEVAMGTIYAVIPLLYFITKPVYGFIIDYFVRQRTFIFTLTVALMGVFYLLIYFVPHTPLQKNTPATSNTTNISCTSVLFCDLHKQDYPNWTVNQICSLSCENGIQENDVELRLLPELCNNTAHDINLNTRCNVTQADCHIDCKYLSPVSFVPLETLYRTSSFWIFVLLMALGSIGFNIVNTASDAICFNALGDGNEMKYGNQRMWGTVGYGITAFLAGYYIDHLSKGLTVKNNTPAFVLLMFFISLDIIVCSRLKFAPIPNSHRIVREACQVLRKPHVMIFVFFSLIIGLCDGFLVYYLFWYMETVANESGYYNKIRLIEGLTVLVQSFGGELLMFPLSGKIIKKIGYGNSLTMCFLFFAVRFLALSFIPNPWWTLPIEMVLFGVTYAFSYCTIVAYVSTISSTKIRGTMQGIVSGCYDGIGYALGSLLGGVLITLYEMRVTFRIFGAIALATAIIHYILYMVYLRKKICTNKEVVYIVPEESSKPVSPDNDDD